MDVLYTFSRRATIAVLMLVSLRCSHPSSTMSTISSKAVPTGTAPVARLRLLQNATQLLSEPRCVPGQWLGFLAPRSRETPWIYLGEHLSPRDRALFASDYDLIFDLVEDLKPDVALLTPQLLQFGNRRKVERIKRSPERVRPWIFDYAAAGVPWTTQKVVSTGSKKPLLVGLRTDGFSPTLFPFIELDKSSSSPELRPQTPSEKPTVFFVRPTKETISKLPRLSSTQWGFVLASTFPKDQRDVARDEVESRGWTWLDESSSLYTIELNDRGANVQPVACAALPDRTAEFAVIKTMDQKIRRVRATPKARKWDEVLGTLPIALSAGTPESSSESSSLTGVWLAELIRAVGHADLALVPVTAVSEKSLPQGKVTRREWLESFPIDDPLVLVDLSGKDIEKIFAHQARLYRQYRVWPFYYAGPSLSVDLSGDGMPQVSASWSTNKLYKMVTYQSVLASSQKYLGLEKGLSMTLVRVRVSEAFDVFSRSVLKEMAGKLRGHTSLQFISKNNGG